MVDDINVFRFYHHSLGALTRAWIMICSRYPRTSGVIVLVAYLAGFQLYFNCPLTALAIFILASIMLGLFIASLDFSYFLGRLNTIVTKREQENFNQTSGHAHVGSLQSTGLKSLDSFATQYTSDLQVLRDELKFTQEETDILIDRYEKLTENLAAAIVIRSPEGKILYCSPFTEVLTGYPIDSFYDESHDFYLSIIHEDDREKFMRAINVSNIGQAYQVRYRFYHQSGLEMWADTRTVPIYADDDSLISSLSITLDVTSSVRQQTQVEEKNRDLEDFSYMISHDLKAPIYTIKGMIQIIKEDFLSKIEDPEFNETLVHIEKALSSLEQLVGSVLEYSRIGREALDRKPVELSDVFSDILNDYSAQIQESQAKIEIDTALPQILGDKLRLYQIFSNLIGNSIKYRSSDRDLVIKVENIDSKNSRQIIIKISDTGSGIPKEKIDAVFRPFQRAHGKEIEGSGIGLACVKKLVNKFGGKVWLESSQDSGTSFYVQLPG